MGSLETQDAVGGTSNQLCEFLVALGWPFEYGSPITFLVTTALGFAFTNRRIRREEADMIAEYGDTYAAYMRTTDRMIPNLW